MTADQFSCLLTNCEKQWKGWIDASNQPCNCDVFVDGQLVKYVERVNRSRGIAQVAYWPFKLDKHRKKIRTYRMRGSIELVPK